MKIENISFIEESSISFVVSPYWEIEESDLLFELILGKKSDLKEKIIGADRLSYRFIYKNKDYFIRHIAIALPLLYALILLSDSYLLGHYTSMLFIFFSAFLYKNYDNEILKDDKVKI